MTADPYQAIARQYPSHIPFPRIDRAHRPGVPLLAQVTSVEDLPSRLLLGELLPETFRPNKSGWSVRYRDPHGNGVDLKVHQDRFEAKLRFLGSQGFSVGPSNNKEAFHQVVSSISPQWNRVLKTDLESKYPIQVIEAGNDAMRASYLPDGWLYTILLPVPTMRLNNLLAAHMMRQCDGAFVAPQMGAVSLLPNWVSYVDNCCLAGDNNEMESHARSLEQCNTPIIGEAICEEIDGEPAWSLRRSTYLYQCTCFLRDVPLVVERLFYAGFLSREPDMQTLVAPAELVLASKNIASWSAERECRVIWETGQMAARACQDNVMEEDSAVLVRQAMKAGRQHATYFGLQA